MHLFQIPLLIHIARHQTRLIGVTSAALFLITWVLCGEVVAAVAFVQRTHSSRRADWQQFYWLYQSPNVALGIVMCFNHLLADDVRVRVVLGANAATFLLTLRLTEYVMRR